LLMVVIVRRSCIVCDAPTFGQGQLIEGHGPGMVMVMVGTSSSWKFTT